MKAHEPIIEEFLECIIESCRNRLIYVQEFAPDEQILKVLGSDGKIMMLPFRSADIRNNTDVYMEKASMMTISRGSKLREIQAIAQSALVQKMNPDQFNAFMESIMKHIHFGEGEQALSEATRDESLAERKIQTIVNGGDIIPPMPWEEHPTMIKIIESRLKSSEFEDYPIDVKNKLVQLWQMTISTIQKATGGATIPPAPQPNNAPPVQGPPNPAPPGM
jgi:hypothetical protein